MALSAKLAMRQGQSMVLTPQLLQAIKLLQMPSAELAAFIETELERNPLLDRADDRRRSRNAERRRTSKAGFGRDARRLGLGEPGVRSRCPRAKSRHRNRERVRPRPCGDTGGTHPYGRGTRPFGDLLDRGERARRRRFHARHRSLPSLDGDLGRAPDPAGDDRVGRPGRPHDRAIPHRRDRRCRLFLRRVGGNGGAAGRAPRSRRSGARAAADARADGRVCPRPRGVPRVAIDRTRPVRSGDARVDREPPRPGQARHGPLAQGLRRRRRGSRAT